MQPHQSLESEIHNRAQRLREMAAGADNVLRLAVNGKRDMPANDELVRNAGRAAIDLLNQAADTVKANEARAEALMQKAIDQLGSAETRIRELEARLADAEARAAEAEAWVQRVHQVVLDRFEEVGIAEQPRRRYAA